MLEKLRRSKLVLFGAGESGKAILEGLLFDNIIPLYFVDNDRTIVSVESSYGTFSVNAPETLLMEDKQNLKILIATKSLLHKEEIDIQLQQMGLEDCIIYEFELPQNIYRTLQHTQERLQHTQERLMVCESMLEYIFETGIVEKRICPACRNKLNAFLPAGVILRKDAQCPYCFALERHRALWLYFEKHTELFIDKNLSDTIKIMHFAPEKVFYDKFSNLSCVDYYPVDANPSIKGIRDVIDIQKINYPDAMFDVILCNHVLEHVPNDHKALKELRRVLKKSGVVYITSPVFDIATTFENSAHNTPELRLKYYGQKDHLRKYGRDFSNRLLDAGFNVDIVELNKDFTVSELYRYGLNGINEKLYICKV